MSTANSLGLTVKVNPSAAGSTAVDSADQATLFVSNNFYTFFLLASSALASMKPGDGNKWNFVDQSTADVLGELYDSLESRIGFPGIYPINSTPPSLPCGVVAVADINPAPGSQIEFFTLGKTGTAPISVKAQLDGTEGDRATILGKLVTALAAAGITATVNSVDITNAGDSDPVTCIKIAANQGLGDQHPFLAYWLPNGQNYAYALAATKNQDGDLAAASTDICYLGTGEAGDTNWIFPKVIGFSTWRE